MKRHSLMGLIFLWLAIAIFSLSCSKESNNGYNIQYVADTIKSNVSGTLYLNCSHVPAIHHMVTLVLDSNGYYHSGAAYVSAYSDSNGAFHFNYLYPTYEGNMGYPSPTNLILPQDSLEFTLAGSNVLNGTTITNTIGNIVLKDTFNLDISLSVTGVYSSQDTLYYGFSNSGHHFAVGPFSNGMLSVLNVTSKNGNVITAGSEAYNLQYAIGLNKYRNAPLINQILHSSCVSPVNTTISL